jgi:GH25 family lysozyme M1 (1,4-beta-N-acetylmuramidase)
MAAAMALGQQSVGAATQPLGIDVSDYQGDVNWSDVAAAGVQFVYIKATEGTYYENADFASQYNGSYDAKLIRGSYHFARPDTTTGATQADYFVAHGGGWSADNQTLPGVLDIEYNPYGAECYGQSASEMVAWVHSFANEYKAKTGRDIIIYTTADWWNTCTGSSTAFGSTNPLWVANYGVSEPALPAGWGVYTFWQYSSTATVSGVSGGCDVNHFNGTAARLLALANNTK